MPKVFVVPVSDVTAGEDVTSAEIKECPERELIDSPENTRYRYPYKSTFVMGIVTMRLHALEQADSPAASCGVDSRGDGGVEARGRSSPPTFSDGGNNDVTISIDADSIPGIQR